jgi:hypothetical protein
MAGQPDGKDLTEPNLLREIGGVALFFLKMGGLAAAVAAMVFPIFRWNQMAGIYTLYGLAYGGMIVFLGYQNFKWKKKDLEWKRKWERDRIDWEERLNGRG